MVGSSLRRWTVKGWRMWTVPLCKNCWSSAATNNQRTLTCYECGNQGHYRSDCPELKNRNHGNQAEGTEARGMEGPCRAESSHLKTSCQENKFSNYIKFCVRIHEARLLRFEIDENLRFVEEPIEIVERDVKKLKRRRIPLVKVRWNSRQGAEYTWEREDQFRKKYPNLFPKSVLSSSAAT
ncbi:putative reverse transcriptase domain-containing protein [Tanacetum coccineum]|uniref:Reverse transcriptase domain-containing protein n=1 Tax=Tanacetum coccineum TaxID=301880 RepID=A0ABQ4YFP8_9ASTR